jgi:hypothetical protein
MFVIWELINNAEDDSSVWRNRGKYEELSFVLEIKFRFVSDEE